MEYVLDTHVLLWRLLEPKRLSLKAQAILKDDDNRFLVPTMVMLETQYLIEIGRIDLDMRDFLEVVSADDHYQFLPFDERVMVQAIHLNDTRDPFDRTILSHALALHKSIITKDRWMKRMAPQLVIF